MGWWVVGVAVEVFYGAGGCLKGGGSLGGGPKPVRVSPEYFLNVVGSGKLERWEGWAKRVGEESRAKRVEAVGEGLLVKVGVLIFYFFWASYYMVVCRCSMQRAGFVAFCPDSCRSWRSRLWKCHVALGWVNWGVICRVLWVCWVVGKSTLALA